MAAAASSRERDPRGHPPSLLTKPIFFHWRYSTMITAPKIYNIYIYIYFFFARLFCAIACSRVKSREPLAEISCSSHDTSPGHLLWQLNVALNDLAPAATSRAGELHAATHHHVGGMPCPGTALHQSHVTWTPNKGGKGVLATSGKDVEVTLRAP